MPLESHGDPRRLLSVDMEDRLWGWLSRAGGIGLAESLVKPLEAAEKHPPQSRAPATDTRYATPHARGTNTNSG